MADRVTLDLRIPAEDTSLYGYALEALGGDLYRVCEVPDLFEVNESFAFQDILRLKRAEDGMMEFVEVAEKGRWRNCLDVIISAQLAESSELAAFLARVEASQGVWVRDFGGWLRVF